MALRAGREVLVLEVVHHRVRLPLGEARTVRRGRERCRAAVRDGQDSHRHVSAAGLGVQRREVVGPEVREERDVLGHDVSKIFRDGLPCNSTSRVRAVKQRVKSRLGLVG